MGSGTGHCDGKKSILYRTSEALDYIAGYCLHNDVSEREFQIERCGTWDKGKGCDHFAPLAPFLATPDEITDVNQSPSMAESKWQNHAGWYNRQPDI